MKDGFISVTVNITKKLKERADAVKERRGDLTLMIEQGLEVVVQEREKKMRCTQAGDGEGSKEVKNGLSSS